MGRRILHSDCLEVRFGLYFKEAEPGDVEPRVQGDAYAGVSLKKGEGQSQHQ